MITRSRWGAGTDEGRNSNGFQPVNPAHKGLTCPPTGVLWRADNAMITAGSEDDLETGISAATKEDLHMYAKLHAVYGVWIVQREGPQ